MFYDELIADTAREREELLSIPFIRDGAAGRLTRVDYIAFLAQAYHHVKHTLPLIMACGARLPERLEWLRTQMTEYVKEETGHQEWILNDIRACGADPESVRGAPPGFATEVMVAYAYDVINRRNPVGFLGMVLVLEGTSTAVATRAAGAMQSALQLPAAAFTYLSSHGTLDVSHIRFYASLVDQLHAPDDRAELLHCARVFYRLYGAIFRDLDARPARKLEAAA